jgi:O-antigen/teichoic acid export membrane protein
VILASLLIRIINSYLASEKKLELQALSNMLQQGLWVILLLAFFLIIKKINLTSVMIFWLLGMIITTLLGLFLVRSSINNKFSNDSVKKAIGFSAPLILFNIGTWLIISAGRYALNQYSTLENVAYYSFAFSLISLISSLATAISGTLYPYFAEAWNANGNHSIFLNASIKYTLIVVLPCISVLFALNKQIIMTISTVKYLAAAPIVLFLLLVPLFSALNYIFTQQLLLKGKTAFLGITHLFVAFFNIILIVPLVKSYGAYGAAISTTLAYFLLFSFIITRLINKIRLNFKYLKIFRIISISIILLVSLMFIKPEGTLPIILSLIFSMILYLILLIILGVLNEEKKIILSYLKSIKDRIYSLIF